MNYWSIVKLIVVRECIRSFRSRLDYFNPLLFFIIVVTLFPLATTPDIKILRLIGPGVIWVAALLAIMLSLSQLFQDDFLDGSLEQFVLSPYPLPLLIGAKVLAHWLILGLPLIVIAPLLAMMFHLSLYALWILMLSLLLGTPILLLIGAIAAALTVGLRNSGLLLALLMLPLYIPTLIFASSAVLAANHGLAIAAQMAMLAALLVLSITLAPLAAAFALRVGVGYD